MTSFVAIPIVNIEDFLLNNNQQIPSSNDKLKYRDVSQDLCCSVATSFNNTCLHMAYLTNFFISSRY